MATMHAAWLIACARQAKGVVQHSLPCKDLTECGGNTSNYSVVASHHIKDSTIVNGGNVGVSSCRCH